MRHPASDETTTHRHGNRAPSYLSLPAELRMLERFFETDDRPSALLAEDESHATHWVSQNDAFRDLGMSKSELKSLLAAREHRIMSGQGQLSEVHSTLVDKGRVWKSGRLADHWWSLTCVQQSGSDKAKKVTSARMRGWGTSDQHPVGDVPDTDSMNGSTSSGSQAPLLDWMSRPQPNLPPYIHFVREFDWASTSLGPIVLWPHMLRVNVFAIMVNPNPKILIWGSSQTFLYNEAASVLIGNKHPWSLGKPIQESWAEVWSEIGPIIDAAYDGVPSQPEKMPLGMERKAGFLEETYWSFCMTPIMDAEGQVLGILDELQECTSMVRSERRRQGMIEVSEHISAASSIDNLWHSCLDGFRPVLEDVPYAMIYSIANDAAETPSDDSGPSNSAKRCILESSVGITIDSASPIQSFSLTEWADDVTGIIKPCLQAWKSGKNVMLSSEDGTLPATFRTAIPGRGFEDKIRTAIVAPIVTASSHETLGILVLGLNPRCPFDEEYSLFTSLTIDLLVKGASLLSLPEEQRKAQRNAASVNMALAQQLQLTTLQAERSEAKFTKMAMESPIGMFAFNADGRPLFVNAAYLELIGETGEGNTRHTEYPSTWSESIHEEDLERFIKQWGVVFESQSPVSIEYRLRKPPGAETERWLLANMFPELGPDGKVSTVMGWLTDVSHNKYSERLATQRLEDALENKRQTENFLDMTSHEMRNPLSAILQSADWIVSTLHREPVQLSPGIADELVDAAETIILCAQHQKRIVDDILTLSKLDASLLIISPDRVQPPLLVSKALKMYEAEITRAGITATLCIEPSYTELEVDFVLLDSSRLLQVIINLITNAIKFTQYADHRRITIFIGASKQKPTGQHHQVDFIPLRQSRPFHGAAEDDDLYIQIAVQDTGAGLSPDEMKVLFQRFSQGNSKTYKQYGGSGLGLFISRELCELQGGQIGVACSGGKTTFTFYVRVKRWIADDEDTSKDLAPVPFISNYVSPYVLRRRGSEDLLGNLLKENAAGAITKVESPVAQVAVTDQTKKRKRTIDVTAGHDSEGMHVLIVEDNIINQRVIAKQLSGNPSVATVHLANHGLEAIKFIENSTYCASETPLSVILLDLEMPTMDGIECIRRIRQMQKTGEISHHIPVLAITANARNEQIAAAIDAGMDRVVTKPFRVPELVPQMEALVIDIARRSHS